MDLLFERLYDKLRPIAAKRLAAERDGHTLSATALVNEVYVKLADLDRLERSSLEPSRRSLVAEGARGAATRERVLL